MAGIYAAESNFHALCLKAKEKLRNAKDRRLPRSILLKRLKIKSREFDEVMKTLLEQGDVVIVLGNQGSVGRNGVVYALRQDWVLSPFRGVKE